MHSVRQNKADFVYILSLRRGLALIKTVLMKAKLTVPLSKLQNLSCLPVFLWPKSSDFFLYIQRLGQRLRRQLRLHIRNEKLTVSHGIPFSARESVKGTRAPKRLF